MSVDIDTFLAGSSRTAFKEKDGVPHTSSGPVVQIGEVRQVRDYDTKLPKCYPGTDDPIMELPVTFNTDERDPDVPGDNGDRTMYFSGNSLKALRQALRDAGNVKLRVGGHLWINKKQEISEKNNKPKNVWAVNYTPAPNGDVDSLLATPEPPYETPAPAPQVSKAADIAAKLAAATAAPAAPVEDPRLAGLSDAQKAAIRNLTAEQAAGAGLEEVWSVLNPGR